MTTSIQGNESSPRGGSRRPALRRDLRQQQLIEAALECISALGLRETTVQDVARRAGMAVGSINQYFDSKEALFTAALRTLSEEFEAGWRRGIERAGDDPAGRLRQFVGCYFDASIGQRRKIAVWFAFWGEVKARPAYRAVCEGYDARHDQTLAQLCGELLPASADRARRGIETAKIIASVCHGLWLELLTGTDGLRRADLERLALATLAALFPEHARAFAAPVPG